MKSTSRQIVGISIIAGILILSGCATQSHVDRDMGQRFLAFAAERASMHDITAYLGSEPSKCETLPPYPVVGLLIENHDGPTVAEIDPHGPAAHTGIQKGDKILFINSKRIESVKEGSEIIKSEATPDQPLTIETQRGTYSFKPEYPRDVRQCYWEVKDVPTQQGRSADRATFKGVCRFFDERASQCEYIYDKTDN